MVKDKRFNREREIFRSLVGIWNVNIYIVGRVKKNLVSRIGLGKVMLMLVERWGVVVFWGEGEVKVGGIF